MAKEDFSWEADEIERHLKNLVPRAHAVVFQLRAVKTLVPKTALWFLSEPRPWPKRCTERIAASLM